MARRVPEGGPIRHEWFLTTMLLKSWQSLWPRLLDHLYVELAWLYDGVSRLVSAGQWRAWQRSVLPYLDGLAAAGWPLRVLEVGHGTGHTLVDLCQLPVDVVGLDAAWPMTKHAQRRLRQSRRLAVVSLVAGQAEALPFCNDAFAAILAVFPTRYVAEPRAVAEFYRVLRPGGQIVIAQTASVTGAGFTDHLVQRLLALARQGQTWPTRLDATYAAQGFQIDRQSVSLERSTVTVFLARKPRTAAPVVPPPPLRL